MPNNWPWFLDEDKSVHEVVFNKPPFTIYRRSLFHEINGEEKEYFFWGRGKHINLVIRDTISQKLIFILNDAFAWEDYFVECICERWQTQGYERLEIFADALIRRVLSLSDVSEIILTDLAPVIELPNESTGSAYSLYVTISLDSKEFASLEASSDKFVLCTDDEVYALLMQNKIMSVLTREILWQCIVSGLIKPSKLQITHL